MTERSAQLRTTDRAYTDGHRFMCGVLGERVATAANLIRDTVSRIRLAPVASYVHCIETWSTKLPSSPRCS
jgi:hypothetical protein